jgi:hypothetical protein
MVLPGSQLTFAPGYPSPQLSPEAFLLILAARVDLSPDDTAKMKCLLKGDIDWHTIMIDSARLGVQSLLYKHLSQTGLLEYVPPDVLASLKSLYRKESLRNVRIYGLIERLLKAFNDAELSMVLLKGAFLARWIYRDIALRPMGDIDLLCREREAHSVKAKLAELGFHQKTVYPSPFHERLYAIDRGWHLKPFYNSKSAMLEVHFSIFPNVPHGFAQMERVWDGVGHHVADGLSVSCLAPADLLLYLCLHLMHHLHLGRWQLYWFSDIHEVVAHYEDKIEWEGLFKTAASLGVRAQVQSILHLLSQHWNVSLPEIQGDFQRLSMATLLRDRLFGGHEESQRAVFRAQLNKLGMLGDISGWRNRAYFLWKLVFPSRENLVGRYHPRNSLTFYLSYLAHPFVMLKRTVISFFYSILCLVRK